MTRSLAALDVLSLSPIMPVVVLEDAALAGPLARALLAGGLKTLEIALRTPASIDAIRVAVAEAPDLVVGAGTVLNEADLNLAIAAGARYALSPGATPSLLQAALRAPIPLVPGVASASEIMIGHEHGYTCFKFFPAESLGGPAALKQLGAPLANARFCPTGGIGPDAVANYLALENVMCVGGSWVAPADKIKARDWTAIEALARQAASFARR